MASKIDNWDILIKKKKGKNIDNRETARLSQAQCFNPNEKAHIHRWPNLDGPINNIRDSSWDPLKDSNMKENLN